MEGERLWECDQSKLPPTQEYSRAERKQVVVTRGNQLQCRVVVVVSGGRGGVVSQTRHPQL